MHVVNLLSVLYSTDTGIELSQGHHKRQVAVEDDGETVTKISSHCDKLKTYTEFATSNCWGVGERRGDCQNSANMTEKELYHCFKF